MFRNSFAGFILIVLFLLVSCHQADEGKWIVTERIQYDVPVSNPDPEADWWVQNLPGPQRETFLKELLSKAKSGDVQAWDYFHKPLTTTNVQQIGIDTLVKRLRRDIPPYEEFDTIVVTSLELKDITRIRFLEEWKMQEGTLNIEKRVIGIAPVKMVEYNGVEYSMPLFWIYLDPEYPGKLLQ
ncbi:MAG: hypothetical protein KKA81_05475 [Bacteroidetes bacterium]|nr:hypothetical protein [Bacteroidota bacterium]